MELKYPFYLYIDNDIKTTFGDMREFVAAIPLIHGLKKEGKYLTIRDADGEMIFEAKNDKILYPLPTEVIK